MTKHPLHNGALRFGIAKILGLATSVMTVAGSGSISAATYYVSPNGGGNGSSAAAPLSAQAGLNTARDGDTVIFLDGTYAPLTLRTRDIGSGTITLRAANPILERIDTSAGTPVGLRSTGAVISGGNRGLDIQNHNGITVEGLKFTGSGQGILFKNVKKITVARNHLHELSGMGIVVSGASDIVMNQNYFTNTRTASVGSYMDYGFFAEHQGPVYADSNLIVGRFNQGMSLKKDVTFAKFSRNVFRCASGSCLMLGQTNDSSTTDRTVGSVEVLDNTFKDIGYTSIFNSNVEAVKIYRNKFINVKNIMYNKYDVATSSSTTVGRLPSVIDFADNSVSGATYIILEGRGNAAERVNLRNTSLSSALRGDCRILRMSTAAKVSNETYNSYPTVSVSGSGLSCKTQ